MSEAIIPGYAYTPEQAEYVREFKKEITKEVVTESGSFEGDDGLYRAKAFVYHLGFDFWNDDDSVCAFVKDFGGPDLKREKRSLIAVE